MYNSCSKLTHFAKKWALKACRFGVVLGGHTFFMGVVLCRFDAKSVSAGILGSGHTGCY